MAAAAGVSCKRLQYKSTSRGFGTIAPVPRTNASGSGGSGWRITPVVAGRWTGAYGFGRAAGNMGQHLLAYDVMGGQVIGGGGATGGSGHGRGGMSHVIGDGRTEGIARRDGAIAGPSTWNSGES